MQKSQGADIGSGEACLIKVNVEFLGQASGANDLLLDQFPSEKEQLQQACDNMPSEAAAMHERENKVKYLTNGVVVQCLQKIFQSVILGYEGTQVNINFTVIECDQDLMQALVNCGSFALL